jgi:hypothetical protein
VQVVILVGHQQPQPIKKHGHFLLGLKEENLEEVVSKFLLLDTQLVLGFF